jgi:hypothetical protein
MKALSDILRRLDQQTGLGGPVSRALVLEAANAWIGGELPNLAGRAAAKSIVGATIVVQCQSGVLAAEVKIRSTRLLAHLKERFGTGAPQALKCLVRQGNLDEY